MIIMDTLNIDILAAFVIPACAMVNLATASTRIQRVGGGGGRVTTTHPAKSQSYWFLSNTRLSPDPLENQKGADPAINVGPSSF